VTLTVVHVTRSAGFAGVERHVASLAAGQAARGHRVQVVGGDLASMRRALGDAGVGVSPAVSLLSTTRMVDRYRHADILHVHMTAAEAAAVLAVRSWRVPAVATRHFARRRGASWAGHLAAPVIPFRLAAEIAVSEYVAQHIGFPSMVIHPGIPAVAGRVPAVGRDPIVLVVQRLEEEKHTDVALRAFAHSGLVQRGWRLEVIGDGSQRKSLGQLAERLGLTSAVCFLGHRQDLPSRMTRAGILLAPCPVEALGLAVLEAMAVGLPVVASRAGGHLETVGSTDGAALFAPRDPEDAATQLFSLAEDLERRERYGMALQEAQRERFTIEAQVRATDAVYRSVL